MVDMTTAVDSTSLYYYVDALAEYISRTPARQSKAIAIEGESGSIKGAVLSSLSSKVREAGSFVVEIDVSRVESSQPLLAELIISARRQLIEQTPKAIRLVRLAGLAVSLTKIRRQRLNALKTVFFTLLYAVVLVEAVNAIVHVGPRHLAKLFAPRSTIGVTESGKNSVSGRGPDADALLEAVASVASPVLGVVLALIVLRQFEKVVPMPSPSTMVAKGFGEEALREHLVFDSKGLEELATTIRSLVADSRVCIVIYGMDWTEPARLIEILSVVRWLLLRSSQPLITVTSIESIYAASALLCANRELFTLMERMVAGPRRGAPASAQGLALNREDQQGEDWNEGVEVAYEHYDRLFDLNIALPRLTSSVLSDLLHSEGGIRRVPGTPMEVGCSQADVEVALNLVSSALGYSFERAVRFSEELRIVWRSVTCASEQSVNGAAEELTIEQAAKVLLALRCWPGLRGDLYRNPNLLSELETIFSGKHGFADLTKNPVVRRWASVQELGALLRCGVVDIEGVGGVNPHGNAEAPCELCQNTPDEGVCPNCGFDGAAVIRKRLQFLKQQRRFSMENARVDALLYAKVLSS
jgi:hypothetical protein